MLWSWTLLAVGVLGFLLAVNVLAPTRAPGGVAVVSFFAGWLVGELAVHALLGQLVLVAVLSWLGALAAWPGLAGAGLSLLACVLLVVAQRRAASAGDAVRAALGPDAAALTTMPPSLGLAPIVFPFPVRHPAVDSRRRVEFQRYGDVTLRLDVHRRRGHEGRGPVLVYVHGGGWVIGHRDKQGLPLMQHLAAHGWVCVSIDYRLSPHATFPDHLVDVKRALVWVRDHAEELGADTSFVAIAGNSAGAHLASLAALTQNRPEYQPGFESGDTTVNACIGFYGIYDLLDRRRLLAHDGMKRLLARHVMKASPETDRPAYEAASPVDRVHAGAPPFLLVHGTHDTLAPVAGARHFAEVLRETSRAKVVYLEVPGAQHAFEIFPSVRTRHVVDGAARFLEDLYRASAKMSRTTPAS
ncbi:MAG: alpha/beta hydrolase [Polyangiaceae bacterium]|jgi:acetyl esterase/lipase